MSEQRTEQRVRGARKTRVGTVVSAKMQQSVIVMLRRRITHPLYGKQSTRSKRVVAHDDAFQAREGDVVRVMETRPLSKTKRWRVVGIVERAE
jgi:small subunit ribosomal protein S17